MLGEVFPTPVGMNRYGLVVTLAQTGVPHARGDEPGAAFICTIWTAGVPQRLLVDPRVVDEPHSAGRLARY